MNTITLLCLVSGLLGACLGAVGTALFFINDAEDES